MSKILSAWSSAVIYLLIVLAIFYVIDFVNNKIFYLFYWTMPKSERVILLTKNLFHVTTCASLMVMLYFKKESRITLSFFLKLCDENIFVKYFRLLPCNIKSINPMQKYPHIIKSQACILKIFVIIFLLTIKPLISSRMCSTLKLSKYAAPLT